MINNDFLCEGKTMERIYLDYAATTPVDKRVLDAMMPYMTTEFGNPSSLHAFGQKARAAVQTARDRVAAAIGAEGREILFTAGGTEADNLALFGYLSRRRAFDNNGRRTCCRFAFLRIFTDQGI